MQITFLQAEFIKQLCEEKLSALKMLKSNNDMMGNVIAVTSFLGEDVASNMIDEKRDEFIAILKEQVLKSKEMIAAINSEFGL